MSENSTPLDHLADTFVCVLDASPTTAAYGPYDAVETFDFLATYNALFASAGWAGTWIAVPIFQKG